MAQAPDNRFALQFKIVLHITYYVYPIGLACKKIHNDHRCTYQFRWIARVPKRCYVVAGSICVCVVEKTCSLLVFVENRNRSGKVLYYGQSEIVTPSNVLSVIRI